MANKLELAPSWAHSPASSWPSAGHGEGQLRIDCGGAPMPAFALDRRMVLWASASASSILDPDHSVDRLNFRAKLGQILGRVRPLQAIRLSHSSHLCRPPEAYRDSRAGSNPYLSAIQEKAPGSESFQGLFRCASLNVLKSAAPIARGEPMRKRGAS